MVVVVEREEQVSYSRVKSRPLNSRIETQVTLLPPQFFPQFYIVTPMISVGQRVGVLSLSSDEKGKEVRFKGEPLELKSMNDHQGEQRGSRGMSPMDVDQSSGIRQRVSPSSQDKPEAVAPSVDE